ncbi:MAG: endolytic transglycosylase MltG [Nocardioides sp.]
MSEFPAEHAEHPEHDEHESPIPTGGGRRRKGRGAKGCLAVLVALVVVVGGFYVAVTKGVDFVSSHFSSAQDFGGPGHGKVSFQVKQGADGASIGRDLKAAGVVASVDAFIQACNAEPQCGSIQVGYYSLQKEMPAADALAVLVDPSNLVKDTVTIPEGLRAVDVAALLAKKTDFGKAAFQKVLDHPGGLGLPSYAQGNPEGYLFPSTYDFGPDEKPADMLHDMVTRWKQAADDVDLEGSAQKLGITPAQLMTVASLVQSEGRGDDMPKIARVIYNRVEHPGTAGTSGLLQIDSTVNYAAGNTLGAVPTTADLALESPYNTYVHPGLPPGPIEAPGDAALQAAAHPADGDWYYYVTVNLRTGETKFASTYNEFLGYKDELRHYCETESQGAC